MESLGRYYFESFSAFLDSVRGRVKGSGKGTVGVREGGGRVLERAGGRALFQV